MNLPVALLSLVVVFSINFTTHASDLDTTETVPSGNNNQTHQEPTVNPDVGTYDADTPLIEIPEELITTISSLIPQSEPFLYDNASEDTQSTESISDTTLVKQSEETVHSETVEHIPTEESSTVTQEDIDFAALIEQINNLSKAEHRDTPATEVPHTNTPTSTTDGAHKQEIDTSTEKKKERLSRILEKLSDTPGAKRGKAGVPAQDLYKLTTQYLVNKQQAAIHTKTQTNNLVAQIGTGIFYTAVTGVVGILVQQGVEKFLQWAAARGLQVTVPEESFDSLPAREIIPQELIDTVNDITNQVLAKKLSIDDVPLTVRSRTDRALAALQLTGGAGNGKTFLVNAAMGEIHKKLRAAGHPGIRMISLSGGDFFFTYFGEGKRAMKATFYKARELRDQGYFAVHYIDEAHTLSENKSNKVGSGSTNVSAEVANVFKINATSKKNAGIAIVASTNIGFDDVAIDRRYDNKIEIKPIDTYEKKVATLRGVLRLRFGTAANNIPQSIIQTVASKLPTVSLDTMFLLAEETRRQASIDPTHTNKNTLTEKHFNKASEIIMEKIRYQKLKEHSDNLPKMWIETPGIWNTVTNTKEWILEHGGKAVTDGVKSTIVQLVTLTLLLPKTLIFG